MPPISLSRNEAIRNSDHFMTNYQSFHSKKYIPFKSGIDFGTVGDPL
jgi:hypothetical protein